MNVHHIQKGIINHIKDIDIDKKINLVISNKNSTFDIIKYRVVRLAARQLTPTQLTTVRLRHHPLTLLLNKKKTFPIRVL